MDNDLQIKESVVKRIETAHPEWKPALDYPGYITLNFEDIARSLQWGTANPEWGADVSKDVGKHCEPVGNEDIASYLVTDLASTEADPDKIAACVIAESE